MGKIWTDMVESHRRELSDAVLDAVGEIVLRDGVLAVSMSRLAEDTGIARATLYKYFGDVEHVLAAWHARHVAGHLAALSAIVEQPSEPAARLKSALREYARICQERCQRGDNALAAALHRSDVVHVQERQLRDLLAALLVEAAAAGTVRDDVPPADLAAYCWHALAAVGDLSTDTMIDQLVDVVMAGLLGASVKTPP